MHAGGCKLILRTFRVLARLALDRADGPPRQVQLHGPRCLAGAVAGITVSVFGLRLWFNLGLPFACPDYAPTGFEPMET